MSKCLMIQGTASNAGKSLLVTALCRIYAKRGFKVAPFKSQNMSLNSYTTRNDEEIAMAQVIQAKAANVEPTADMNPILLKPKGNFKSQVILRGKSVGDKDFFRKYDVNSSDDDLLDEYNYRKMAKNAVSQSLDSLKKDYDVVIMEGAGSPAEINLREGDLANMGAAEIADANVLLVGDIDKGGVFASLAGTFLLLDDKDTSRFKGAIINKFRGNVDLLKPGIDQIEQIIKVPILGVVPYADGLNLPEEDSASLKEHFDNIGVKDNIDYDKKIVIGVIKLPKISNFTDIDPLEFEEDVEILMIDVTRDVSLDGIDALILPGTRNSTEDMKILTEYGLDVKIKDASLNIPIVGICGGYQILGKTIFDEDNKESGVGTINGLGLLDIESYFERDEKVVKQSTATVSLDSSNVCSENIGKIFSNILGEKIHGYELHEGTTKLLSSKHLFEVNEGFGNNGIDGFDGAYKNNVFGTYFHGLFNNFNLRREFLNYLREKKGLDLKYDDYYESSVECSIEKLAQIVEDNLDMDYIDNLIFSE